MFKLHGRRNNLLSISDMYYCSIIGTCFSRTELRQLVKKTGIQLELDASEHQMHVALVSQASKAKEGKILSKILDAKFPQSIKRLRTLSSDGELRGAWLEARESGRLAGTYWALMSHPNASDDLLTEIHGEVHMLSHELVNQQQRDLRLLREMRQQNQLLQEQLTRMRQRQEQRLAAWQEESAASLKRLQQAEDQARRYRQAAAELDELKAGTELARLREQVATLERKLAAALREVKKRQLDVDLLAGERERLLRRDAGQLDKSRQQIRQGRSLPETGQSSPDCMICRDQLTPDCPGPDLCGRKILYVGGVNRLVPHYREMIEKHGGCFFHHDGGQEESTKKLPQLLCQVDAVFCPINCVSHNACLCVKKFCKRKAKPFVLMRSSSLSSLSEGLKRLR